MSRIPLMRGFTMIEEGLHVLKITQVEYNEQFGKLNITMENSKGARHFEHFRLISNDGSTNNSAIGAFTALAIAALNLAEDVSELDPTALIGSYVKAELEYEEYPDKDGNTKKTTVKAKGTYWNAVTPEEIVQFGGVVPAPQRAETSSLSSNDDMMDFLNS